MYIFLESWWVLYNILLTNLPCSSCTGKYWPSVIFVRTLLCPVCTAITSGQCSPVGPSCSVSKSLIIFAVEPEVSTQECPSPVTEGSNVTLHCNASGNPPPSITWIWQDTGDVLTRRELLILTAVNGSQAGSYQCLASNGIGNNSTRTCNLDVLCK